MNTEKFDAKYSCWNRPLPAHCREMVGLKLGERVTLLAARDSLESGCRTPCGQVLGTTTPPRIKPMRLNNSIAQFPVFYFLARWASPTAMPAIQCYDVSWNQFGFWLCGCSPAFGRHNKFEKTLGKFDCPPKCPFLVLGVLVTITALQTLGAKHD